MEFWSVCSSDFVELLRQKKINNFKQKFLQICRFFLLTFPRHLKARYHSVILGNHLILVRIWRRKSRLDIQIPNDSSVSIHIKIYKNFKYLFVKFCGTFGTTISFKKILQICRFLYDLIQTLKIGILFGNLDNVRGNIDILTK